MFCSSCGISISEDSRFCESCGSAVKNFDLVPKKESSPVIETQSPPEGFSQDPYSSLYYITTVAPNPETGELGQWVTWFYPETGEYKQQFTPDPSQPALAGTLDKRTSKQKLSPLYFIIPAIGLIAGVLIAFIQHGVIN